MRRDDRELLAGFGVRVGAGLGGAMALMLALKLDAGDPFGVIQVVMLGAIIGMFLGGIAQIPHRT
jgi:hypothetical protein